jgi:hypothetical protein
MDKYTIRKIAKEYSVHVKSNKNTLLAKIFGLFSLKMFSINKLYFIIMENLEYDIGGDIAFKYDLKFSERNRQHITNFKDICFILSYL